MSRDSYEAARILMENCRWRSSISRSYFAAYAAATSFLVEKIKIRKRFAHNWRNPSHEELVDLVSEHLKGFLAKYYRDEIAKSILRLCKARVDADYRKQEVVDEQIARQSFRDAGSVLAILKEF